MTQPGWNQSYGSQQSGYNGAQYPPQYSNQQYGQSRGYSQNQQQYAYAQNQPGSGNNTNEYPKNERPGSEPSEPKNTVLVWSLQRLYWHLLSALA